MHPVYCKTFQGCYNRAFTIMIKGKPNDFAIKIGMGELVQNLAVAAAGALLLSDLFLAVEVPEMLWTKVVEDGMANDISGMATAASPLEK